MCCCVGVRYLHFGSFYFCLREKRDLFLNYKEGRWLWRTLRFSSDLLRLEESIVRAAHQLKSYCLRLIQEVRFHVARGTFDMLRHRLAYEFQQYCEQCFQLGINVSNPRCLVLTDDEAAGDEDVRLYQL